MLKFGMIGCGSAAEIRGGLGIRLSGKAELVAVADNDYGRADAYATRSGSIDGTATATT